MYVCLVCTSPHIARRPAIDSQCGKVLSRRRSRRLALVYNLNYTATCNDYSVHRDVCMYEHVFTDIYILSVLRLVIYLKSVVDYVSAVLPIPIVIESTAQESQPRERNYLCPKLWKTSSSKRFATTLQLEWPTHCRVLSIYNVIYTKVQIHRH